MALRAPYYGLNTNALRILAKPKHIVFEFLSVNNLTQRNFRNKYYISQNRALIDTQQIELYTTYSSFSLQC